MQKEEIKKYFDEFAKKNKITMSAYSYFYFYMMEYLNKTKTCLVAKHPTKEAIFIYYKRNNKMYYPFMPLVKFEITETTKYEYYEIIDYFSSKLKLILIDFVPHELKEYLTKYKTQKLDKTYLYDTNNFVNLEGAKNKPIRRFKNKYTSINTNVSIVKATTEHVSQISQLFKDWKNEAIKRLFRIYDTTENKNILQNLNIDNGVKRFDFVLINNDNIDAYVCFYEMFPGSNDLILSTIKARHYIPTNEGINEYFFSETLKKVNELGYKIVNHGSDMNLKGLRAFKLKLNPCLVLENFKLKI